MTTRDLAVRVEFVQKNSRLMPILDESHYLLPRSFSRNTPPKRWDWLRTHIIDRGISVVLVETPQTPRNGQTAEQRYLLKTGYDFRQIKGRTCKTVELPEKLSRADFAAVIGIKFPGLDNTLVTRAVSAVLMSPREAPCLFDGEKILKLARFAAKQAGRAAITAQDLEKGVIEAGFDLPRNPMLKAPMRTPEQIPAAAPL